MRYRAALAAALLAAPLALTAHPVTAEVLAPTSSSAGAWQLEVGPFGGGTWYDPDLRNFRWDVTGTHTLGLSALTRHGRWGMGLRASRGWTTQTTGIPGETQAPTVRLTRVEFQGQARLARWRGIEAFASAHGGRVHMGYDPDVLVIDPGNGSTVKVSFAPIDEWIAGGGFGLRAETFSRLALGLHIERTYFALSTKHRNGTDIEEERETFGNWALRFSLAWIF